MRELLIAYVALTREKLTETHNHRQLLYQIRVIWGSKDKNGRTLEPPKTPPLLEDVRQQ